MASGEETWCQGWSEPDAGSDLAAIASKAVRDEAAGGWRLNGQKTWTTRGAFCTHLFGLFRTDPDSARHKGLTYLLVPLATPGVTVRGFGRLDGDEGFAEVFFDEAFLADESRSAGRRSCAGRWRPVAASSSARSTTDMRRARRPVESPSSSRSCRPRFRFGP
jgi:alkylation response protein AidB-like acyl-CoA dehydrogenase